MRRSEKQAQVKETSQRNEASRVSSRSHTRQEGNEERTDQQMRTRPGTAALTINAEDNGVRTVPHSEPGVDSLVSNLMKEMGRSSDDHTSINRVKSQESCQTECVSHSPVSISTLTPPQPSTDPIQESPAVVFRTRQAPPEKPSASSDMDTAHENCSEQHVVSDVPTLETNQSTISELRAATTPSSVEEIRCVGMKAQDDSERDEKQEIVTEFAETKETLMIDPTFKGSHNKGDVSLTKPILSELHSVSGETSCKLEELVKLRIHKKEVEKKTDEIQEKIQDHFCECSERKNQTSVNPVQILKDWSRLKKMIQSLAANTSQISRDNPGSLTQQMSHLENILKNITEIVSDQQETGNQELKSNMMGIKPALEHEVPVKDIPDMRKTPTDPEHMEPSTARNSVVVPNCKVSGMLGTDSVFLDAWGLPASNDQQATENRSEVMFCNCKLKGEATKSSEEERSMVSFGRSHSNPAVTSCSEEFLLVEPHTKMVDQGLGDSSGNQNMGVVAKNTQSQNMSFRKSDPGPSSKIRRLIVTTTEEIKMMSVPELVLMSLPEGRVEECGPTIKLTEWNTEDPEELPLGEIDSCEEVVEVATQDQATQQHHPATGSSTEHICPETRCVKHPRGRKRLSLDSRKDQKQTDCKIS